MQAYRIWSSKKEKRKGKKKVGLTSSVSGKEAQRKRTEVCVEEGLLSCRMGVRTVHCGRWPGPASSQPDLGAGYPKLET